jgi:hypothetical protein
MHTACGQITKDYSNKTEIMYKQIKLKTHSTSNTETAKLNLTDAE